MPDSWAKANSVPTWMPVAPAARAAARASGEPVPPASQKGRPNSTMRSLSALSRSP